MFRRILIGCILLFSAMANPVFAQSSVDRLPNGYSVEPYKTAVFDEARVAVETVVFNNWLNLNIGNMQNKTHDEVKGPREHLYYLIDSRIKHLYSAEKMLLPQNGDPILQMLFSWSEKLGVYGGNYAFNAVKMPSAEGMKPLMKTPAGISMSMVDDTFSIKSDYGWRIKFPYNFMVFFVSDFFAKGVNRTQMVILSTGATRDKQQPGYSQGTLVFLFSPQKQEIFHEFWLEAYKINSDTEYKSLKVENLQSQSKFDKTLMLQTEFTSWSNKNGSYAVVYSGNSGTYEANRSHFLDFLKIALDSAPQGHTLQE